MTHDAFAANLTIRPATAQDAPDLSRLLTQLGWPVTPEAAGAEVTAQPGTETFVAEGNDTVLGLVVTNTRRFFHRADLQTTIDVLVVDERARSRGIGGALVNHAVKVAHARGAKAIELASNVTRADARRFYERHGLAVRANYFVRDL